MGRHKLNTELVWESIETRTIIKCFHEVGKNKTRPFIKKILPNKKKYNVTLQSGFFLNYSCQTFAKNFSKRFTKTVGKSPSPSELFQD